MMTIVTGRKNSIVVFGGPNRGVNGVSFRQSSPGKTTGNYSLLYGHLRNDKERFPNAIKIQQVLPSRGTFFPPDVGAWPNFDPNTAMQR